MLEWLMPHPMRWSKFIFPTLPRQRPMNVRRTLALFTETHRHQLLRQPGRRRFPARDPHPRRHGRLADAAARDHRRRPQRQTDARLFRTADAVSPATKPGPHLHAACAGRGLMRVSGYEMRVSGCGILVSGSKEAIPHLESRIPDPVVMFNTPCDDTPQATSTTTRAENHHQKTIDVP